MSGEGVGASPSVGMEVGMTTCVSSLLESSCRVWKRADREG